MSDQGVTITAVSPVIYFILYLCEHSGFSFSEAEKYADKVSYVDGDGLRQYLPEWIPHLPREAFPPPQMMEGI